MLRIFIRELLVVFVITTFISPPLYIPISMTESPNAADLMEALKSVGLTKYEALVYIALLRVEGATATEIHEISGVPRASVYPVLDRLIQKNLVIVSHSTPKRFRATPPEEGIDNLLRQIEADADAAKEVLSEIYRQRVTAEAGMEELIWSIYGEEKIIQRLEELISHAGSSIRIISSWQFLKKNIHSVMHAARRDISVEIISDQPSPPEDCPASVRWIALPVSLQPAQPRVENLAGIFIVDGEKALLVMGSKDAAPTALYSESAGFVNFFTHYWSFIRGLHTMHDQ
jgi:sugar-specific transcriptional regulator TrmB